MKEYDEDEASVSGQCPRCRSVHFNIFEFAVGGGHMAMNQCVVTAGLNGFILVLV